MKVKVKLSLCLSTTSQSYKERLEVKVLKVFLILALKRSEWLASCFDHFAPAERALCTC